MFNSFGFLKDLEMSRFCDRITISAMYKFTNTNAIVDLFNRILNTIKQENPQTVDYVQYNTPDFPLYSSNGIVSDFSGMIFCEDANLNLMQSKNDCSSYHFYFTGKIFEAAKILNILNEQQAINSYAEFLFKQ